MRPRSAIRAWLLLLGLFVLGTFTQGQVEPPLETLATYGTPRAVFDAMIEAAKKKDFATAMRCMTPEAQSQWTVELAGMGSMIHFMATKHEDPMKIVAEFDEILVKHGLTKEFMYRYLSTTGWAESTRECPNGRPHVPKKSVPTKHEIEVEEAKKALAARVKDKPAFANDVITFGEKIIRSTLLPDDCKLKDLKINGNTARGMIVGTTDGAYRKDPLDFVKVGGGWRIAIASTFKKKTNHRGTEGTEKCTE